MKGLIIGLYAIPSLLIVGLSVTAVEPLYVLLRGSAACSAIAVFTVGLTGFVRSKRQLLRLLVPGALLALLLVVSVMATHWPLRAAYALSRPEFEKVAFELRAGGQFTEPKQVGFFYIRMAEVNRNDILCLWRDPDTRGRTGFVQCGPDYVPFNLWSIIRLDERWQFITED